MRTDNRLEELKNNIANIVNTSRSHMDAINKVADYTLELLEQERKSGRLKALQYKHQYINQKIKNKRFYLGGDEAAIPLIAQAQNVKRQIEKLDLSPSKTE